MAAPVMITHHGKARVVLLSFDEFEKLRTAPGVPSAPEGATVNGQLNALMNEMRDGFIAYDAQLKIIETNHACELYLGFSRDELIGRDLRDLVPETRNQVSWDHIRRVLRTGQRVEFTMRSALRDGTRMAVQAFPYDGHGVGLIFNNLGPAEDAAKYLRRLQAVEAAVRAEPSMSLIRLNPRGGIESVDQKFCDLTGFSEAQLLQMILPDIIVADQRVFFMRALNAFLKSARSASVETTILARGGAERRLRLNFGGTSEDVLSEVAVSVVELSAD